MEARLKKLEKAVQQQGYLLLILMIFLIVDTAAVLLLWSERGPPDFDHIAVSLTIFQTLFGIAALYGFWALRGLTKEQAEETTTREVAKLAPPLINRQVAEYMRTFPGEAPISDVDLNAMVVAAGEDGKEDKDGKK